MRRITAHIEVTCPEKEYEPISTFLKTIVHTLDIAVEGRHELNDFRFEIEGAHPASTTTLNPEENPMRKTLGL